MCPRKISLRSVRYRTNDRNEQQCNLTEERNGQTQNKQRGVTHILGSLQTVEMLTEVLKNYIEFV